MDYYIVRRLLLSACCGMMCHTASAMLRSIRTHPFVSLQRRCFSTDSMSKYNVNMQDKHGNTLLHYALLSKHSPSQITQLITYGADTEIQNRSGYSPMDIAYTQLAQASYIFGSMPRLATLEQFAGAYRMYIALDPCIKNPLVNEDIPSHGTVADALLRHRGIQLDSEHVRHGGASLLEDMFRVCSDDELVPALYSYWSNPAYGHVNPLRYSRETPTILHLAVNNGHAHIVEAMCHVAHMYAANMQNWQYKAAYENMHLWVRDRNGLNAISRIVYTLAQSSTPLQDANVMYGTLSQTVPNHIMRIGVHPDHVRMLHQRATSWRNTISS